MSWLDDDHPMCRGTFAYTYGDTRPITTPLADCRACAATGKCEPVRWHELDDDMWRLTMRCPECETWFVLDAPQAEADALDRHMQRSRRAIEGFLAGWEAAARADEIERFANALARDAILPCDFGWPT